MTILQSRYEVREVEVQETTWARYRGLDLRLGREVAIRTFCLPMPQADVDYKSMDVRMSQLVSLRLPEVAPFLDMGFHQRLGFVVSEWPTWVPLTARLARGKLDWVEAQEVLHALLQILHALQAAGVPHGRLEPSSVLLGPQNQVVLRDFSLGPTDGLPDDAPSIPPEGAVLSFAADLFACGVLLKSMLGPQPEEAGRLWVERLTAKDPTQREQGVLAWLSEQNPVQTSARSRRPARWRWLIALAVLVALGTWLWFTAPPGDVRHAAPSPTEADGAYRRGRFSLGKRTHEDLKQAEQSFSACLKLQPTHHQAWAGLSVVHALQGVYGMLPVDLAKQQARDAANRALALHPRDAEATAVLAYVAFRYDWDWSAAGVLFEQAVAHEPANSLVRHWYGIYLSMAGRHREALVHLREAVRLDPVDMQGLTNQGVAEVWAGETESGIQTLRRVMELDREFRSAWDRLIWVLESENRIPEALQELQKRVRVGQFAPEALAMLEQRFRSSGAKGYLRERLTQNQGGATIQRMAWHVWLGDVDAAFRIIDGLVEKRDLFVVWIPGDPAYRLLHQDPRYGAFLRRIGHPRAPR